MNRTAAVLVISDRCSAKEAKDASGPVLIEFLRGKGFAQVEYSVVPDELDQIQATIKAWSDNDQINVILTSGGTGFGPRDVTPEAIKPLIERDAPGIALALMCGSLKVTAMAMLSRMVSGIRKRSLIVTLPRSAKACKECVAMIEPILDHAVHLLTDDKAKVEVQHSSMAKSDDHLSDASALVKSKVKITGPASRDRSSRFPMITMDEAIQIIMAEASTCIVGDHLLKLAHMKSLPGHHILAESAIYAKVPLPPFPASVKDGYAVVTSDGAGTRRVINTASLAGTEPAPLLIRPGECMRINTGAPLPKGADAVVQVEDTELSSVDPKNPDEEFEILIRKAPVIGQDIRPIGSDIPVDQRKPLLEVGCALGPIEMSLLASVGVSEVRVYKTPTVAILSTGDEIVDPSEPLRPGCVWDSNRIMLHALLTKEGFNVLDLGIARDNPDEIYGKCLSGLQSADVLITSGGVSMGERDLLKSILATDFNANIHFGRVNVKPGKPLTFATCTSVDERKRLIFSLPGNPVSAFVTCYLFVLPAIKVIGGRKILPASQLQSSEDFKTLNVHSFHNLIQVKLQMEEGKQLKQDSRPEFLRAKIDFAHLDNGLPTASIIRGQQSSRLLSAQGANALLCISGSTEPNQEPVKNGSILKAILIN